MGIYDREYYRGEVGGSGLFGGVSPVCNALIAINVVVFILLQIFNVDVDFVRDWLAASPYEFWHHGKVWQLLTATFLHDSHPWHILGNMLFLWFVGREMESLYGSRDFLAFYLSAAVVSTLGELVFDAARGTTGRDSGLSAVNLAGQVREIFSPVERLWDVSRDGRVLVEMGETRGQIVALPPGASRERDLSWFDTSVAVDLTPDGRNLLFNEGSDIPSVYYRRTDGSEAKQLGEGRALALSPDGKWVLAARHGARTQLLLLPTAAGEQRTLPAGSVDLVYWAAWFPDSRRIVFAALSIPRLTAMRLPHGATRMLGTSSGSACVSAETRACSRQPRPGR